MHIIGGNKENLAWRRESMVSDETRGLSFYEKNLHINRANLAGKIILDLGSGKEAAFERDIRSENLPGTKVVSLTPHFSEKDFREDALKSGGVIDPVAGLAQALPFKDKTFDYVFGVWSVPFHLRANGISAPEEEVQKSLAEALRVLTPGGELRLFPFIEDDMLSLRAVLEKQGILGVEYEIEPENILVLKKKHHQQLAA